MTDNEVYGVSSSLADYQIAYLLNKYWHTDILRLKDGGANEVVQTPYTLFGECDFQTQRGTFLITNKRHHQILLDRAKPFDYVLYFQYQDPKLVVACISKLRSTDNIAIIKGLGLIEKHPTLLNIISQTTHENNPYNQS